MARGRHPHKFARDGGRKVAAALQARKEKPTAVVTLTAKQVKDIHAKAGKKFDPAIAQKWKDGASIGKLAAEYKMKRSQIRRAITLGVGGKAQFKELRAAGAGGTVVPFGGKRSSGRTREAIALDDSKVPVLKSKDVRLKLSAAVITQLDALRGELGARLDEDIPQSERMRIETGHDNAQRIVAQAKTDARSKGWKVEHYSTATGSQPRLIAPDGKTYVRASSTERADYIVQTDIGPSRFKVESEARVAKAEAKHAAEVEKGTAALKATRARKREARKQRKARRTK